VILHNHIVMQVVEEGLGAWRVCGCDTVCGCSQPRVCVCVSGARVMRVRRSCCCGHGTFATTLVTGLRLGLRR
jgi:hypothetical protein